MNEADAGQATEAHGARSAPRLPRPLEALGRVVDGIVVAIGAVMIAIVFANVVFHLFGRDNPWTIELSEFLMVWVTFLGGACAARRNAHMTITEIVDRLAPRARRLADLAIQAVTMAVLGLLAWFGMGIVNASWGNELTVLRIPMALQYLALPVGSVAMLAFVAWDAWLIAKGVPREHRYATEGELVVAANAGAPLLSGGTTLVSRLRGRDRP